MIGPDQAPTAAFSTVAKPPGRLPSFDGSQSSSPVGSIARYAWGLRGFGQTAASTVPVIQHVYATSGVRHRAPDGHQHRRHFTGTGLHRPDRQQRRRALGKGRSHHHHPRADHHRSPPSTTTGADSPTRAAGLAADHLTTLILDHRTPPGQTVRRPTAADRRDPSCRRPVHLQVRYTLTAAATVTLTLARQTPGRVTKHRCRRPHRRQPPARPLHPPDRGRGTAHHNRQRRHALADVDRPPERRLARPRQLPANDHTTRRTPTLGYVRDHPLTRQHTATSARHSQAPRRRRLIACRNLESGSRAGHPRSDCTHKRPDTSWQLGASTLPLRSGPATDSLVWGLLSGELREEEQSAPPS